MNEWILLFLRVQITEASLSSFIPLLIYMQQTRVSIIIFIKKIGMLKRLACLSNSGSFSKPTFRFCSKVNNYLINGFPMTYNEQLIKKELELTDECLIYLIKKQSEDQQNFTGKVLIQTKENLYDQWNNQTHHLSLHKMEVHQIEEDIRKVVKMSASESQAQKEKQMKSNKNKGEKEDSSVQMR